MVDQCRRDAVRRAAGGRENHLVSIRAGGLEGRWTHVLCLNAGPSLSPGPARYDGRPKPIMKQPPVCPREPVRGPDPSQPLPSTCAEADRAHCRMYW